MAGLACAADRATCHSRSAWKRGPKVHSRPSVASSPRLSPLSLGRAASAEAVLVRPLAAEDSAMDEECPGGAGAPPQDPSDRQDRGDPVSGAPRAMDWWWRRDQVAANAAATHYR
jgi:hypothetical protein